MFAVHQLFSTYILFWSVNPQDMISSELASSESWEKVEATVYAPDNGRPWLLNLDLTAEVKTQQNSAHSPWPLLGHCHRCTSIENTLKSGVGALPPQHRSTSPWAPPILMSQALRQRFLWRSWARKMCLLNWWRLQRLTKLNTAVREITDMRKRWQSLEIGRQEMTRGMLRRCLTSRLSCASLNYASRRSATGPAHKWSTPTHWSSQSHQPQHPGPPPRQDHQLCKVPPYPMHQQVLLCMTNLGVLVSNTSFNWAGFMSFNGNNST